MVVITAKKIEMNKPNAKREELLAKVSKIIKTINNHPAFKNGKNERIEREVMDLKKQIEGIKPYSTREEIQQIKKAVDSVSLYLKGIVRNKRPIREPMAEDIQ
ncbi:MAG: hypothetical protein N3G22_03145 [Candidatus Micrarchaeota archaeon]|nr:hypothetical protein [Candidatus Micrarchaeota archaeon]